MSLRKKSKRTPFPFVKMEGLGNDFVLLDLRRRGLPRLAGLARALCHRQWGVGADQLLVLSRSRVAQARLIIYNADGSRAGMCGNGLRCVALYLRGQGGTGCRRITIESERGLHRPRFVSGSIRVNLGPPLFEPGQIPLAASGPAWPLRLSAGDRIWQGYPVGMGNPHCVFFIEEEGAPLVRRYGPLIERLRQFPQRTNVEFVRVTGPGALRVDVWERGAGPTLACGSGACAAAVAALRRGLVRSPVAVQMPGGRLSVRWPGQGEVELGGPARLCFRGQFEPRDFARLARRLISAKNNKE